MCEAIELSNGRFYGVYLLCSQSPERRYNGKCYIGFTVNPNRRIDQHNRGKDFGGAKKTNNKGPWKMVMIVHGFPNNIAALQFEWAWQQPALSTRLKNYTELRRKKPKETYFQYNFRILTRMLLVGPWNRLPLTIRWLETDYECDFAPSTLPPSHMQIVSGKIAVSNSIKSTNSNSQSQPRALWAMECHLCMQPIENPQRSRMGCLNNLCKLTCHIICLANHLLSANVDNRGHYIPISGECPLCETQLTWVELLRRKQKIEGIAQEDYEELQADDENEEFSFDVASDESDLEEGLELQNENDNYDVYELSD